jgi:hypothetical protein
MHGHVDYPSSSSTFPKVNQSIPITDNQEIGSCSPNCNHNANEEEEEEEDNTDQDVGVVVVMEKKIQSSNYSIT